VLAVYRRPGGGWRSDGHSLKLLGQVRLRLKRRARLPFARVGLVPARASALAAGGSRPADPNRASMETSEELAVEPAPNGSRRGGKNFQRQLEAEAERLEREVATFYRATEDRASALAQEKVGE